MQFELGEDASLFQKNIADFGRQSIAPEAAEWDAAGHLPASLVTRLGELGLLGLCVPESLGGSGLRLVDVAASLEELAVADGSVALLVATHNLAFLGLVLRAAPQDVRSAVVPELVTGKALGTWAWAEQGASADWRGIRTLADHAEGTWTLEGTKRFVPGGEVASHALVLATTDPEGDRDQLAAFVVPTQAQGAKLTATPTLGMHAAALSDLELEKAKVGDSVTAGFQVGHVGGLTEHLAAMQTDMRIALAAIAVGLGRAAMERARDYAKEREQFGKPIAAFQGIQWKLADMATELDAARLLVHRAAWLRDRGASAAVEAARAKAFAGVRARAACSEALQIHGGYGYTQEFPVERYLRDVRWCELAEGTSNAQKVDVARAIESRFSA